MIDRALSYLTTKVSVERQTRNPGEILRCGFKPRQKGGAGTSSLRILENWSAFGWVPAGVLMLKAEFAGLLPP